MRIYEIIISYRPLENIGKMSGLPQDHVCTLSLKTESNSTGFSFHPENTVTPRSYSKLLQKFDAKRSLLRINSLFDSLYFMYNRNHYLKNHRNIPLDLNCFLIRCSVLYIIEFKKKNVVIKKLTRQYCLWKN